MRQFEIPYTFKRQHIEYLEDTIPNIKEKIHSIYLPAYYGHSISTRLDMSGVVNILPDSIDKYQKEAEYLKKKGYEINILFQDTQKVMSDEILDFYINELGIKEFTVYLDETAKAIKRKCSDAVVIASILKQYSFQDLMNKDLSLYDFIVLDFRLNLRPDIVKRLPKRNKYILMPNSLCRANAPLSRCAAHWRNELKQDCLFDPKESCYVKPEELSNFDDYISFYKLQGRECIDSDLEYYNRIIPFLNA